MKRSETKYVRKFLNPSKGLAAILAEWNPDWGGKLVISDCRRSIELEFNTPDEFGGSYKQLLKKIDIILDTAYWLKAQIEASIPEKKEHE